MYIGGFKPIKDKKDLLTRLLILVVGIPIIYLIYLYEQKELNKPIDQYERILGKVVDIGTKKNQYIDKYYIRIKNNTGTYKLEISKDIAPSDFLKILKINKQATAWVTRDLGNIELVQLKLSNNYIIKHEH